MVNENKRDVELKSESCLNDKNNLKLKWYVIHTYSGFENKAKEILRERIKQQNFENKFGEILIPIETVERIRNGKRHSQNKKCFPSYMFVQMNFSEETAHLVRNTSKITGFVGNAKNPPNLTESEVKRMQFIATEAPKKRIAVEYCIGDLVKVTDGPFSNFNGSIEEIKPEKQKLRVMVSIFGRSTPVELDYVQVDRI